MVETIFSSLPEMFIKGTVTEPTVYYFSLGDVKKTVHLSDQACVVDNGRTVDDADCVCKTDQIFFMSVWNDGYRPAMGNFLSDKIKSNNPSALQLFWEAFGKQ